MLRTHDLGALSAENIGQTVTLAGWVGRRRDHGGVAFVDLRDASGVAQIVVRDEEQFHQLRNEYVLQVTGTVERRPEGNENPNLPSGEVEVMVDELTVLNTAAPLPFQIDEHVEVGEEARLKYRYLDLRRPEPARIMRLRSEVNRVARTLLHEQGFTEVETPTLTRSTPEGARDFLVPARLAPGSWYALPQSPQLFKQLLQVGGIEKYFQIARCYRDEDFRADRQPEFTQLDVEASFVEEDDVIALGEQIVKALWALIGVDITTPIPRMTYAQAMADYGSDKPDLRFDLKLTELTEYFKDTPFRVFQAPYVGAVVMPGGASQPRRQLDAWQEWAKQRGAKGLAYVLFKEDGEIAGPVAKNISEQEKAGLAEAVGAQPGDCVFFAAGGVKTSRALLGAARVEIGHRVGLIDENDWAFVWVVDAPLFEPAADAVESGDVAVGSGAWTAVHHAFTSPKPEFMDTFDTDPGSALAYAYDIVCNGNEIGGGSIRIHRRDVQDRVFRVMGLSEEDAREKFGFLLDAFQFGAPPHGGIAFGWDRVVALLAGTESIRDVIAFPKTGNGYDPLTAAPAPITAQQRKEAGVDARPEKKTGDKAAATGEDGTSR
ncbi:aspartate--tRNA ligase [Kocuria tytonicola]|uniref:Aspartate--tRNA(Asp/Asn) ligase n=1 Tax=Kocuria tytonicola TaxID=2055946 RepID=A0A3L9LFR6_9MICC|nr:aspartate--tRNA ligase [Kocuria tytonicola]RLY95012.1 aspartate--tRNA ligase [Kocuria tytonicola]RLZ02938.1 aspartate--tRNA ligase [Kocuria tytonicola]